MGFKEVVEVLARLGWRRNNALLAKRLYEISASGRACLVHWTSTLETYLKAVGTLLHEAKAAVGRKPKRRKIEG
jgi:hypothetical protein